MGTIQWSSVVLQDSYAELLFKKNKIKIMRISEAVSGGKAFEAV